MTTRILAVVFCFSFVIGFCAQADLEGDLISAWTFDDGSAKDAVGSNNGEIDGAVVVDGRFFKGLDFNGAGAFVRIEHDPSMEGIVDELTASAWVFIRSFPQPNHAGIIVKGLMIGWSQNYSFRIATREVNQLTWAVPKPGIEGNFNTDGTANVDEWTFVCLTADGTTTRAYVAVEGDLKEVGSTGQAAPYQARIGDPVEIGVGRARDGVVGNDIFFDGIIDEVYMWSRALAADEIAELAAGARPSTIAGAVEPVAKLAVAWGSIK